MYCAICGREAQVNAGHELTLCALCAAWGNDRVQDEAQRIVNEKRAIMRRLGFTNDLTDTE